jgi:chromosomal replication initiation ATPase DnaA
MTKTAAIRNNAQEAPPLREQIWLVQAAVAHVTGVSLTDLCASTRRCPRVAFARQIAMYLSHVVFHMRLSDVARAFGRDCSTVAYAFHRIEELREDPELDRTLAWLEAMLRRTARDA